MSQFLFQYVRLEPPTWVFLSTLLVIGLFLMFHRFWSLRNLDILLILAFTPGMMMVYEGRQRAFEMVDHGAEMMAGNSPESIDSSESVDSIPTNLIQPPKHNWNAQSLVYWGFLWLIVCAGLLLIRMLLDTSIVRRPLLDPNLSSSGMLFLGTSLLIYLMVNVATSNPIEQQRSSPEMGPGYVLLCALPQIATTPQAPLEISQARSDRADFKLTIAKILAIGANLTLVFCILAIGYWHFGNLKTGVGAATFYLLFPYTAHMTGRVDHVVPSALLLLAILMYRQPFVAGLFLGCSAGVVYYPFSLLPLWCSFYWQRGIRRFTGGFVVAISALVVAMIFIHPNSFMQDLRYMFGLKQVAMNGMDGIWGLGWYPVMRIPIIVAFVLLSLSFVMWPPQKNLATLLSCSAAIMAATQFWHGFGGGLYMAWFIPLALLTVFRPNLDYCIALEVVRPTRKKLARKAASNSETTEADPSQPPA
ncbi:MAG: hypothetical protein ABL921_05925 [Pirellula sp.]